MNYLYKRTIEPIQFAQHQNAIIRYIHCQDYRKGIAAKNETINPFGAADYIRGLLNAYNGATHDEKVEFLRHPNSQRKFFKIINGLFLYFHLGWASKLPVTYLHKLLKLLTLDPDVESSFYHSDGFTANSLEQTLPYLYHDTSDDRLGKNLIRVRELVFMAAQKYPELELKLFSNQNIQDLLINKAIYYSPIYKADPIKQVARILFILSRTSIYSNGILTNEAILKHVPSIELKDDTDVCLFKSITFLATILITFLDNPEELSGYFSSSTPQLMIRLNKIIASEVKMRRENILPSLFFNGSCSFDFDLSHQKRYTSLVASFSLLIEEVTRLKSTFFFTSSRNDFSTQISSFRTYIRWGNHLSKQEHKTDYIGLLDEGLSPDFVARVSLHDMLYPKKTLTPRLLSHDPEYDNLIESSGEFKHRSTW